MSSLALLAEQAQGLQALRERTFEHPDHLEEPLEEPQPRVPVIEDRFP